MAYEKMGKPVSHINFHGRSYPVWKVACGRKTVTVSSMELLDRVNCSHMTVANDPEVDAIEREIDHCVGPDEGPDVVVYLTKTVRRGVLL